MSLSGVRTRWTGIVRNGAGTRSTGIQRYRAAGAPDRTHASVTEPARRHVGRRSTKTLAIVNGLHTWSSTSPRSCRRPARSARSSCSGWSKRCRPTGVGVPAWSLELGEQRALPSGDGRIDQGTNLVVGVVELARQFEREAFGAGASSCSIMRSVSVRGVEESPGSPRLVQRHDVMALPEAEATATTPANPVNTLAGRAVGWPCGPWL